jgi:transposase
MKKPTINCYEQCINKKFLLSESLILAADEILTKIFGKSKRAGRPRLSEIRMLQGIFYILKTGVHWNGIPRCFGSYSAIHRFFQILIMHDFFKFLWGHELEIYDKKHGIKLGKQAADCVQRKSPLGSEKVGKSPVDRRKHGSKTSALAATTGIPIGLAVGPANQHDAQLLFETIKSIPIPLNQPRYKEMHLDAIYDSAEIRTLLFHYNYIPKIANNPRNSKQDKPRFPLGYDRWFIESVHSWFNRFRAVFVRYSKYAKNYLGLLQFAAANIIAKKL